MRSPPPELVRLVVLDVLTEKRRHRRDLALRWAAVVVPAALTLLGWWRS